MEQNLGIGQLNIGFSSEGFEEYKSKLQVELIQNTSEKLKDTNTVIQTLNSGWQGKSRDVFVEQLQRTVTNIINDLEREYDDLCARFAEIENNYYEQDNHLMDN